MVPIQKVGYLKNSSGLREDTLSLMSGSGYIRPCTCHDNLWRDSISRGLTAPHRDSGPIVIRTSRVAKVDLKLQSRQTTCNTL
ncbi:hypothetical protein GE061_006573 [Apolygus lucorum]|uniref:Uncharacterized protein n=1 Tax=Apolygus lucorum TaxID=248454 RepID=A0A8S9WTK3_APOLU|nr:hypothetical protein GE061_006573 [Apolygus lucorum]